MRYINLHLHYITFTSCTRQMNEILLFGMVPTGTQAVSSFFFLPVGRHMLPLYDSASSRMRVMNRNWSATKQRLHPQCSRDKPPFSFVRGQDLTMWDIVWVSPQGHRSMSVSRHFLLQAPQCLCSSADACLMVPSAN